MKSKTEILAELNPREIKFKVDAFEELILQDMSKFDDDLKVKLNRNLTKLFNWWLENKVNQKEQIKINIKGSTRAGKSLVGLKIIEKVTSMYDYLNFDTEYQVCANQKELKQKLQNAEFGTSFLIDENAFANVGAGSYTETQQLKDINNIIAKQNIHMIYITPEIFLNVGATIGLSYWGKDTKNWVSRFLLYSLKGNAPSLLGYVILDVGELFRKTGCLIYSKTGGCTNPKRLQITDIPKEYILHSDCIPIDIKNELDKYYNIDESNTLIHNAKKTCPFYELCNSQLKIYEMKKDKWIAREMKGGINEREKERLEVALLLYKQLISIDEKTNNIRLNAKNGKELKLKVKMKLPLITNSKYTGTEVDEILQLVISLMGTEFFQEVCSLLELDFEKEYTSLFDENKPITSINNGIDVLNSNNDYEDLDNDSDIDENLLNNEDLEFKKPKKENNKKLDEY
jgi:hypothetical protein